MTVQSEGATAPPGVRESGRLVGKGRSSRSMVTVALALAGATVAVAALSLLIGSRSVSPVVVWDTLTAYDKDSPLQAIVAARIPRTVVALVVGGALGLAGAAMQGLTRNPLADPGILGIHAGASLGMVLAVSVFGIAQLQGYIWFALVGAALSAIVVHGVASLGRDGATPVKLAIAGAAVAAGLSSWTSALLLTDRQTLDVFRFWQVGTVGGRDFDNLLPVVPFFAVGAILALGTMRVLNSLALGDDMARALGRRTTLDRVIIGLAIVLLCGAATAVAGPIVFVGLVVPHAARMLFGSDYVKVVPISMVLGALLVVLADVVGRVVLPPREVQVGIMTAVIGAPVFIELVRRGRLGAL